MTKKLKGILEKAKFKDKGEFSEFLIIPTNEIYDGFWGKNGFNKIIILARDHKENEWVELSKCSDVVCLMKNCGANFDVPSDLECIRMFLDKPAFVYGGLSTITIDEEC